MSATCCRNSCSRNRNRPGKEDHALQKTLRPDRRLLCDPVGRAAALLRQTGATLRPDLQTRAEARARGKADRGASRVAGVREVGMWKLRATPVQDSLRAAGGRHAV